MKTKTGIFLSLVLLLSVSACAHAGEAPGGAVRPQAAEAASSGQVLSPDQFVGNQDAIAGYTAAKQCPEVCAQLFCYCGCDDQDGHKSLLDCFTSDHGSDCTVCTGEAEMAAKMKRAGKSIAQIQKCVDLTFAKLYPYQRKSPALLAYRQNRLWKATDAEAAKERPLTNPPVDTILSGAKRGNCCGAVQKK